MSNEGSRLADTNPAILLTSLQHRVTLVSFLVFTSILHIKLEIGEIPLPAPAELYTSVLANEGTGSTPASVL